MIIDAKAVFVTILVVSAGLYFGLRFARAFALQIARENHDAILAMDQADHEQRRKREKAAEAAEAKALAKVQPLLVAKIPTSSSGSMTATSSAPPASLAVATETMPLTSTLETV